MRPTQAGAIKVFTDVRSARNMDRPGLQELLAYVRKGDTLAVVRLDRLGRSLGELLTTVTMLKNPHLCEVVADSTTDRARAGERFQTPHQGSEIIKRLIVSKRGSASGRSNTVEQQR